jgi:hypothetical protein
MVIWLRKWTNGIEIYDFALYYSLKVNIYHIYRCIIVCMVYIYVDNLLINLTAIILIIQDYKIFLLLFLFLI